MDERFKFQDVVFVWDRAKAELNRTKHGIAFEDAVEAFFVPFVLTTDANSDEEARDAIIGLDSRWNLLFVVHIIFENDAIRLISARKATRNERRMYED